MTVFNENNQEIKTINIDEDEMAHTTLLELALVQVAELNFK